MFNDFAQELGRAISFAARHHKDQSDKGGNAYMLHALAVMYSVQHLGNRAMIVGVCHDVFEDHYIDGTDTSRLEVGFNLFKQEVTTDVDVITSLRLMTHLPGVPYMKYIRNMINDLFARSAKKGDLDQNSRLARLKGITDKDLARGKKYNAAYLYLDGQTDKLLGAFE